MITEKKKTNKDEIESQKVFQGRNVKRSNKNAINKALVGRGGPKKEV